MGGLSGSGFVAAVAGRRGGGPRSTVALGGGVRFAFYGRMSTSEFQDAVTSRGWQRAVAEELVEGVGVIVADFFDEGRSRRWSWWDRPAAAALLTAAEDQGREFDAVVVGEYERAFYGDQFREVLDRLNGLGVQVWLPEAGGPVELDSLMCPGFGGVGLLDDRHLSDPTGGSSRAPEIPTRVPPQGA